MTTELDIINGMLGVTGVSPVSSVTDLHPAALSAQTLLTRLNKDFQLRGWWFNRERELTLLPSTAGEIIFPANCLRVDINGTADLVKRDGRFYDRKRHSFMFTQGVKVDIIALIDIGDLPESAASYLTNLARQQFYADQDGTDQVKYADLKNSALMAKALLDAENLDQEKTNSHNRIMSRYLKLHYGGSYRHTSKLLGGYLES